MRRVLIGFVGFLLLVVIVAIAGLAYVRSEAGSRKILEIARTKLASDYATQLDYAEGRIDVLRGLHFKNLKVVSQQPGWPEPAIVEIEALDVGYELSLLARRLDVSEVRVLNPKIRARIVAKEDPTTAPTPTPTPAPGRSLDDLIQNPPVELRVKNVAVENLILDVAMDSAQGSNEAVLKGFKFHLALEMLRGSLKIAGDLDTGEGLRAKTTSPAQSASLIAVAKGKWDVDVHRSSNQWLYTVKPSEWIGEVKQVKFDSKELQANAPLTKFTATAEIKAQSRELFKLDANAVETLALKAELRGSPLSIEQTPAKAPKQNITMGAQTAQLSAKLAGNQIDVYANARVADLNAKPTTIKPMTFAADLSGQLPRDLSKFGLRASARVADIEVLSSTLEGSQSAGELRAKGHVDIKADARLAAYLAPAEILRTSGAITPTLDFEVVRAANRETEAKLTGEIPRIVLPTLKTSSAIALASQANVNADATQAKAKLDVHLQNAELGEWKVLTQATTSLPPTDAPKASLPAIKGEGRTEIAQLNKPTAKTPLLPASFPKPFTVTHAYDLATKPGRFEVKVEIPEIEMPSIATLENTLVNFTAKSPDLAAARDIDITAELTQGRVQLARPLAEKAIKQISGAVVKLAATLRNADEFTLDDFSANIDGSTVQAKAQATGSLKSKNLQAKAELSLKVPVEFPPLAGVDLRGRFEVPINIDVLEGREISLVGHVNARDLSVVKDQIAARGIAGRFPFNEKLLWDGKNLRFASLITQNPFERVDFERVRPLLQGSEQFRIDELQWEEKTYGPFIGFFSLRQNVIYAHQFDMDIGSGRLSGEFFFDAYPRNLQLGSLARITNVNLGEVLPKKYLARAPGGDKNVSGHSGFVVNLNRGTMDGRIDVTEIGGPQLIAMANILDPAYEDEKLNKVRTLLQVGYPTQVQLEFAEGYLNMDIGLSVLGIQQRQIVRGVPISSLLGRATSAIVKETEKGPLK